MRTMNILKSMFVLGNNRIIIQTNIYLFIMWVPLIWCNKTVKCVFGKTTKKFCLTSGTSQWNHGSGVLGHYNSRSISLILNLIIRLFI